MKPTNQHPPEREREREREGEEGRVVWWEKKCTSQIDTQKVRTFPGKNQKQRGSRRRVYRQTIGR
jgi:hypothetical protein